LLLVSTFEEIATIYENTILAGACMDAMQGALRAWPP
jgi:hypothetical protein